MARKTSVWQIRTDLPPISPESRLLWDRNTNVKGRASEEIRAKTAKQTERLRDTTKKASLEIKDKLFNQLNKRLEDIHLERERQNHYWRMKTKDSPYRYDQNEVDLRNAEAMRDKKREQSSRAARFRKMAAMTGEPCMDFYTEQLRASLGTQERLAMEHFRQLEQLKVVRQEHAALTHMLHESCDEAEMKFAAVALQLATRRQQQRMGNSANDHSAESVSSNSWSSISHPKFSAERAREIKEQDLRIYQADGRWNESGQFVPVRTEQDRVGLMSAEFALITGNKASKNLAQKHKDYGRLVEV